MSWSRRRLQPRGTLPPRSLPNLLAQAAEQSARENDDDAGMLAAAERARRLAQKAIAEGKAGIVTDGKTTVIVEK